MRKRLYEIVEQSTENDKASKVYDIFMMVVIFISLVPLAFKKDYNALLIIDKVAAGIFIVEYNTMAHSRYEDEKRKTVICFISIFYDGNH